MNYKKIKIKVLHLSYSCDIGGAARASSRIHKSLIKEKIKSRMCIVKSNTINLDKSYYFPQNFFDKDTFKLKIFFLRLIQAFLNNNSQKITLNILPSNFYKHINSSNFDIINIHWIGNETISLEDIEKIKKPILWTMHDMNQFQSLEHYDSRIKKNIIYKKLDKINFKRKKKLYHKINYFVAVSDWLKKKAITSKLLKKKNIYLAANTIDTSFWKHNSRYSSRNELKIKNDKFVIGFGGLFNPKLSNLKGFDILQKIIKSKILKKNKSKIIFIFFGHGKFKEYYFNEFKIINFGKLDEDKKILKYYNTLDIFLNLSKQEAFGQTVLEAQSCSVPCVAFKNTGATDIILNNKTGWLIDLYSINKIGKLINYAIKNKEKVKLMGDNARKNVIKKFDYSIISKKYIKIYKEILINK